MYVGNHTLTVVYGGQWGSEGKGQVVAALAKKAHPHPVVALRVGGPNAGHTALAVDGEFIKAQQVPVPCFTYEQALGVIGCSAVILPEVLEAELARLSGLWPTPALLWVDRQAVVITEAMLREEQTLKTSIGSTGEGVGAATSAKVMRRGTTFEQWLGYEAETIAERYPNLWHRFQPEEHGDVLDTVRALTELRQSSIERDWLIEGTQGYQLSLNTSGYYPFCTSRDCGPDALLAQCGVPAGAFRKTVRLCVLRTYPIRVGGNSGPLPGEITWDELRALSDGYVDTPELTTVTKKVRRIARWSEETVERTLYETYPDALAITFLDYLFPEVAGTTRNVDLSQRALEWLAALQRRYGVPVTWVSTGSQQKFTFPVYV